MQEKNSNTYNLEFKVDAIYFDKESIHDVKTFIGSDISCGVPVLVHGAHMGNPALYIYGHYGTQIVPCGHWIVRWPTGEYSPFSKEDFKSLFVED